MRVCLRESEVVEMMRMGHWPAACDDELRLHVSACRGCGEVVAVKAALAAMHARDKGRARLEAPGVLLWRAQLRRRRAAMEQAARPIAQAYLLAVGALLVAAAGLCFTWWPGSIDWAGSLMAITQGSAGLMAGVMGAAILLVAGMVAYLAADRD